MTNCSVFQGSPSEVLNKIWTNLLDATLRAFET